jgi:HD-GYP domain-containing protein (c-di-GMP phosphodiesterase class II)
VQGAAFGLLGVTGKPHAFSTEELELFCLLASQAGVALEHAGLYQQLRIAYLETTGALAEAINSRDPYTGGHIERVRDDALLLGDALGLSQQDREILRIAAMLHDIGKIGIEDRILRKKAALTLAEQAQMRQHPEIGARILGGAESLAAVSVAVRHHHEWFDGSGYPDGLAGEAIPLQARIIAIADAFDALTTDRPYQSAASMEQALAAIQAATGTQFDPVLVATFVQLMSH